MEVTMGSIRVGEENSTQIYIHYEDLGRGTACLTEPKEEQCQR
jgi:hypothetical protein